MSGSAEASAQGSRGNAPAWAPELQQKDLIPGKDRRVRRKGGNEPSWASDLEQMDLHQWGGEYDR